MNRRKAITLIISLLTLACLLFTIVSIRGEITETLGLLKSASYGWLLLIIPNIIIMFYCAGRIWYPFIGKQYGISTLELTKMQYEQNFITTATPAGEISALVYIVERMKPFGVPKGMSSAMYVLRYVVSTGTNLIGMLVALAIMFFLGRLNNLDILPLIAITVIVILALIVFFLGFTALTGKIKSKNQKLASLINELHDAFMMVQKDKKSLLQAIIWGSLYTLFEDLPFLIVALALGKPNIFLEIVVAGVAGNFADAIFPNPGAVGGFDVAMIWLLGGIGVGVSTAATITIIERILFITITTITGYPFFQKGMLSMNQ